MNTIGFLGAGNMGAAIMKGIAGSDFAADTELYAYNPTAAKVDALAPFGVKKCESEAYSRRVHKGIPESRTGKGKRRKSKSFYAVS